MTQLTLLGTPLIRFGCIHCSWVGNEPLIKEEHEVCPLCEWVCYEEKDWKSLGNCYKQIEDKVKRYLK